MFILFNNNNNNNDFLGSHKYNIVLYCFMISEYYLINKYSLSANRNNANRLIYSLP